MTELRARFMNMMISLADRSRHASLMRVILHFTMPNYMRILIEILIILRLIIAIFSFCRQE